VWEVSLLVYHCFTARNTLFTLFIFNVYDTHITSTPQKSHSARNLLKIDTKHGILSRKLTLVLLKHIFYTLNQKFSTKIKSVQYVSQRGYMGVVFKKYSEFPWRILNICKTNIYLPIYRSLEMITLIMALLWVLFSINIQMLKLRSGIGLKFMLIKESKLNSIKHFCATFWYYCIKLHNFNF
jgi:hypothetical protein